MSCKHTFLLIDCSYVCCSRVTSEVIDVPSRSGDESSYHTYNAQCITRAYSASSHTSLIPKHRSLIYGEAVFHHEIHGCFAGVQYFYRLYISVSCRAACCGPFDVSRSESAKDRDCHLSKDLLLWMNAYVITFFTTGPHKATSRTARSTCNSHFSILSPTKGGGCHCTTTGAYGYYTAVLSLE